MNKVILVGRLTKDPDVRFTQSGKNVATFTLAVDRWTAGQDKQADFVPCVAWEKTAELIGNNLEKGRKILVEGRLQIRSYEDKSGQQRKATEVIIQSVEFLDGRNSGGHSATGNEPVARAKATEGTFGPDIYPDDDVPF